MNTLWCAIETIKERNFTRTRPAIVKSEFFKIQIPEKKVNRKLNAGNRYRLIKKKREQEEKESETKSSLNETILANAPGESDALLISNP